MLIHNGNQRVVNAVSFDFVSTNWVKSVASATKAAALAALLASCSLLPTVDLGIIELNPKPEGPIQGDVLGFVYADEPLAGRAGSDILREGGTAADAATAIFFTMAVTYPTGAGLGAGGSCVYWNEAQNAAYGFDFPNISTGPGGADYPVPGAVAGFGQLHAYYGRLPWARVLVRSELYARDGFYASRASTRAIRGLSPSARGNVLLKALLRDVRGNEVDEESVMRNRELAQTLTLLRVKGAKDFYSGELAQQIAAASELVGGGPDGRDLLTYRVDVSGATVIGLRGGLAHLGGNGMLGSRFAVNMLTDATVMASIADLSISARTQVLQMVEQREREAVGLPKEGAAGRDAGSAGFAVVDLAGNVAACGVSLGGPVGSQRLVGDMGFVFGNPVEIPEGKDGYSGTVPMILTRKGNFRAAIVGAGGYGSVAGAASLAAPDLIDGEVSLSSLIRFSSSPKAGKVSGLACTSTTIQDADSCEVEPSPRGFGLAERVRAE